MFSAFYCPLIQESCQTSDCMWFDADVEKCAILLISDGLFAINSELSNLTLTEEIDDD